MLTCRFDGIHLQLSHFLPSPAPAAFPVHDFRVRFLGPHGQHTLQHPLDRLWPYIKYLQLAGDGVSWATWARRGSMNRPCSQLFTRAVTRDSSCMNLLCCMVLKLPYILPHVWGMTCLCQTRMVLSGARHLARSAAEQRPGGCLACS